MILDTLNEKREESKNNLIEFSLVFINVVFLLIVQLFLREPFEVPLKV